MKVEEIVEVLPDQSSILVSVLIGVVEPKDASKLLAFASNCLPMIGFDLCHLKRLRNVKTVESTETATAATITATATATATPIDATSTINCESITNTLEMLICPASYSDIDHDKNVKHIVSLCVGTRYIDVCKYEPNTYEEFIKCNAIWPTNYTRKTALVPILSDSEKKAIEEHVRYNMMLVSSDHEKCMSELNWCRNGCGAIIVDPVDNTTIMTSYDAIAHMIKLNGYESSKNHPLYTPGMLCIEGVSAICRSELPNVIDGYPLNSVRTTKLPDDHYLCTGLDLYLLHEADVMTAMALVHSRIRRVYYRRNQSISTSAANSYNIHLLKSLNHHYQVFEVTLDDGGNRDDYSDEI